MDKDLLEILACPRCHGSLELYVENGVDKGLICRACGVLFPIRDGIPVMLLEECVPLHTVIPQCDTKQGA